MFASVSGSVHDGATALPVPSLCPSVRRGVIRDQNDQRVLVDIIVERAEQLGQEERAETALQQEAELVFVFHGAGRLDNPHSL